MQNSVSSVNSYQSASTYTNTREIKKELDKDDFLSLMITQLKNQDPLEPMDNSEFISQSTQFSMLEQMMNITDAIENITTSSKSSGLFSAANFIGKEISFYGDSVTLKDGTGKLSFDLADSAAKVDVTIYNSDGEAVSVVNANNLSAGANSLSWDGKSIDGSQLTDGNYSYSVKAYDASGNAVSARNTSTGIVKGVLNDSGTILFDIGSTIVSNENVYSVYDHVTE